MVWQNARLAILWDVSYVLETATRIAAGDVPYRDFPIPYAPLTFLVQAAIVRLFGRVYWHHIVYAAVACGAATALTYAIVRRLVPRATAFFLTLPLVLLGIYCVFPHPFYDPDACLAVVGCLALVLGEWRPSPGLRPPSPRSRGEGSSSSVPSPRERGEGPRSGGEGRHSRYLVIGALCIVPLFVKQNIGLAFVAALAIVFVLEKRWRMLAGLALGAAAALALVASFFGLGNYVTWTLSFAVARRLPPLAQVLAVYGDPIVFGGTIVMIAVLLSRRIPRVVLGVPWLFVLIRFFFTDASARAIDLLSLWPMLLAVATVAAVVTWRAEEPVLRAVPLVVVATANGALLSLSTWGSTYGIWPLLVILLAFVLRAAKAPAYVAAFAGGVTLLAAADYLRVEGRLDYVNWSDGATHASSLPALRGLHVRGEWLPELDELVAWTDAHVPRHDGILFLPGEDLFYFATGRRPRFPVLLFDRTVNPYTPAQLAALAAERRIRWVIVKRRLQIETTPYRELGETLALLRARYRPVAVLRNYVVLAESE